MKIGKLKEYKNLSQFISIKIKTKKELKKDYSCMEKILVTKQAKRSKISTKIKIKSFRKQNFKKYCGIQFCII